MSLSIQEIEEKVATIITSQLGVERKSVTLEAELIRDLGADSLDVVELVMAMEEAFSIDIPDEEAENIRAVRDIVNFVHKAKEN
jgi:acyl carrier protein